MGLVFTFPVHGKGAWESMPGARASVQRGARLFWPLALRGMRQRRSVTLRDTRAHTASQRRVENLNNSQMNVWTPELQAMYAYHSGTAQIPLLLDSNEAALQLMLHRNMVSYCKKGPYYN